HQQGFFNDTGDNNNFSIWFLAIDELLFREKKVIAWILLNFYFFPQFFIPAKSNLRSETRQQTLG
ncbi:MAG: hypothetical protein NUV73_03220, partial [Candidatus Daviesbacteria bacterium]|nr:hypothetical protein [Candidatus Daviesbacteria bacterium]